MYLRLLRHTVERALSDYVYGTSQGRRQLGDGSIFMASGWPGKGHGALLKIAEGLSSRLTGHKMCPNGGSLDPSWLLSEPPFGTYPEFPNSLSTLDFSQLRAEGVGMLLTHPLKERPAIDAPIPCSLIFCQEGRSALKWATRGLLAPSAWGYPFGSASTARLPPRAHKETVCEGHRFFACRPRIPTRRKSQGIHGSVG